MTIDNVLNTIPQDYRMTVEGLGRRFHPRHFRRVLERVASNSKRELLTIRFIRYDGDVHHHDFYKARFSSEGRILLTRCHALGRAFS